MLYMTNDEKTEFEVKYTDKKNIKKWSEDDISLFLDMDSNIHRSRDEKVDSKGRFRANMHRLAKNRYLEELGARKHPLSTSITLKKYRILEPISKDLLENITEAINLKAKKTVIKESNQCGKEIKKRKRSENTCCSLKKLKKSLPSQGKWSPQPGLLRRDDPVCLPSTVSPTLSLSACLPDPVTETSAQPENSSGISPLHDMRNEVFKSIPAETFVPKSSPDLQGETCYVQDIVGSNRLDVCVTDKIQTINSNEDNCYVQDIVGSNGLDECATDKFQTTNSNEESCYVQDIVGSNGLDVCATDKFQTNHSDEDNLLLNAIKIKELEFGSELPQENTNQSGSDVYVTDNPEMKEMFLFRSGTDTPILKSDQFLNLGNLQLNKMEYRSDLCQENQNVLQLGAIQMNEMEFRCNMYEEDSINQIVLDLDAIPVNEVEYRSDLSELNNINRSLLDLDAIEPNKKEYRYGSSEQNNINQSALDFDNFFGWLHMDDGNCDDNCK